MLPKVAPVLLPTYVLLRRDPDHSPTVLVFLKLLRGTFNVEIPVRGMDGQSSDL